MAPYEVRCELRSFFFLTHILSRHACGEWKATYESMVWPNKIRLHVQVKTQVIEPWWYAFKVTYFACSKGIRWYSHGYCLCCQTNVKRWVITNLVEYCTHSIHLRYETARKIKESQDAYCMKALDGQIDQLGLFPEDLQYEAVVDILRGKAKVCLSIPRC